jgi:hypothetical protein
MCNYETSLRKSKTFLSQELGSTLDSSKSLADRPRCAIVARLTPKSLAKHTLSLRQYQWFM